MLVPWSQNGVFRGNAKGKTMLSLKHWSDCHYAVPACARSPVYSCDTSSRTYRNTLQLPVFYVRKLEIILILCMII